MHIDRRFLFANAALLLAGFATFGALYDVQPLLPAFAVQFAIAPATASLALSTTTLVLAFTMLAVGSLAEAWARKATITASLVLSAAITLAISAAPSFPALVALRLLEGIALSGVPAVAMAYLSEEIEPLSLGFAMGVYVGGTGLGGMFGRLVVGVVSDAYGWRVALVAMAAISALCAIGVLILLPPSRRFVPRRQSLAQARAAYASHLRDGGLRALYAIAFLAMGGFVTVYNYLGFRLVAPPYGLSQAAIGSIFIVYLAGTFAAAIMGRLADRFTRRNVMWISMLVLIAGLSCTLAAPLPAIVAGMLVLTFGFFGVHSLASSWVGRRALRDKAHAAALYLFAYYAGSSVLGTLGGLAYTAGGWSGTVLVVAIEFGIAFAIAVLFLRTLAAKAPSAGAARM